MGTPPESSAFVIYSRTQKVLFKNKRENQWNDLINDCL